MRERLAAALERVRRHSFPLALAAGLATVLLTTLWVSGAALDRAAEWRERTEALFESRGVIERWSADLVPPAPAESAAWERVAEAVRERGIDPAARIAVMQTIAERAESLGLRNVHVTFTSADSLTVGSIRELDGEVFELAPYGLSVGLAGPFGRVARFLAELPPAVEVYGLELNRIPEGVEASLTLIVYLGRGSGAGAAAR